MVAGVDADVGGVSDDVGDCVDVGDIGDNPGAGAGGVGDEVGDEVGAGVGGVGDDVGASVGSVAGFWKANCSQTNVRRQRSVHHWALQSGR